MKSVIIVCFSLFILADSLVIYRRKPKPKLVCHAEGVDEKSDPGAPTTTSSTDRVKEFTESIATRERRGTANVEAVIDLEVRLVIQVPLYMCLFTERRYKRL